MQCIENAIFSLLGGKKIEEKLSRCQSFRPGSIPKWRSQTNLSWRSTIKLLNGIEIFDAIRLRQIIHEIVTNNAAIFNRQNLFITAFGEEGKSGNPIVYEFRHSALASKKKYISGWEVAKLPEKSTVLFVDDIIGTGSQSVGFIIDDLNPFLNPSHEAYLLAVCATVEGMDKVEAETNFRVITGLVLEEEKYNHYSDASKYFTEKEKQKLVQLNKSLKITGRPDYDLGFLISFYYSPPNNSMPILWKEGYKYNDLKGRQKTWQALIPRNY